MISSYFSWLVAVAPRSDDGPGSRIEAAERNASQGGTARSFLNDFEAVVHSCAEHRLGGRARLFGADPFREVAGTLDRVH